MKAQVYLICLQVPLTPLNGGSRQAKHYVGWTAADDVHTRLETHRSGKGATFLRECNRRKISYDIAFVWELETCAEAKALERKLKNEGHYIRHCPVCRKDHHDPETS